MSSTLYDHGSVSIDRDFARFGAKSYAIDKINSVEIRTTKGSKAGFYIALIFAILFGMAALGGTASPDSSGVGGSLVIFVLASAFAIYRYKNPKPDHHRLFLMTSSSEAQALESNDTDEINRLRAAIEHAMTDKRS